MTEGASERRGDGSASRPQQKRNIDAIAKVEAAVLGERTAGERFVRVLIRRIGTPGSAVVHAIVLLGWLAWNTVAHGPWPAFDPLPFPLLSFATSSEAILLGLLILVSQNRLQHEADRRAHLTLQIGMMTEMESTKMLELLDRLCRHAGIEGMGGALIEELTSDTDPESIVATLKSSMPDEE